MKEAFRNVAKGLVYIVMEYITGPTLKSYLGTKDGAIRADALSEKEAKEIVLQLLEAVQYLHENGICHRYDLNLIHLET